MVERWWQRGVIYQLYPRSFADSDGDGVGDLRGIAERLEYLVELGVDAVWLSPISPSPMTDFGYDVSDYCGVDPLFGSMADFDRLTERAHGLGLKLILDLVPNHTSDQHSWFQESRRRQGGKEDWYLWRDPGPNGGPPTNWLAHFGGEAWTFDTLRSQYYYHSFLPTQPDLNWRHPSVREAIYDAMRFWLDRGVDGFRVDVMWLLIKDSAFRDNPPNLTWREGMRPFLRQLPVYTADQPEVFGIVAQMRRVVDAYADRVLIGEIYMPIERLVAYYGDGLSGAHLPFNFHLLQLQTWTAGAIAALILRYEAALPTGAWPNWVLGNHDRRRVASRVGAAQARVAAMLLLTLRGTPTLYMGDELGMVDTPIPKEATRDPAELREPGLGMGRDPVRTPFPWDASSKRGFTTGLPWLPFGGDAPLSVQREDPRSMYWLYRRLLKLRRCEPALAVGSVAEVRAEGDVLRYVRSFAGRRLEVALNIGEAEARVVLPPGLMVGDTEPAQERMVAGGEMILQPGRGVVLRAGG